MFGVNPANENFLKSKRSADGLISDTARRKISKALDFLLLIANEKKAVTNWNGKQFKFRMVFITLTLPSQQIHSDNEIKEKCLNQFLIECRKYYKVSNYIWRAEKQKNGNIHFHIAADKFIPWNEIRNRWNRIVNKLGYVDRYQEQLKQFHANGFQLRKELLKHWPAAKQRKAWEEGVKCGWSNPNSTDIHSIRKIQNIKRYVSKYMVKNESNYAKMSKDEIEMMKVKGRLWGCNKELGEAKPPVVEVDNEISADMWKLINETNCKVYQGDYFTVFEIDYNMLSQHKENVIFKIFADYLLRQFSPDKNVLFN